MRSTGTTYEWELTTHLELKRAFDSNKSVQLKIMGDDGDWIGHIDLYPGCMKLDKDTQKHYNVEVLASDPVNKAATVRCIGFFVGGKLKKLLSVPEVHVEELWEIRFAPGDLIVG